MQEIAARARRKRRNRLDRIRAATCENRQPGNADRHAPTCDTFAPDPQRQHDETAEPWHAIHPERNCNPAREPCPCLDLARGKAHL